MRNPALGESEVNHHDALERFQVLLCKPEEVIEWQLLCFAFSNALIKRYLPRLISSSSYSIS